MTFSLSVKYHIIMFIFMTFLPEVVKELWPCAKNEITIEIVP